MVETTHDGYDSEDIILLNILRCEPPTLAIDFFGYGGLTRSVFRLLMEEMPDLDAILEKKGTSNISIPRSASVDSQEAHTLDYATNHDISTVLANSHNNRSRQADAKLFTRSRVMGTDGKEYIANFLALEIYRQSGNGNKGINPIWTLGLYLTKPGEKDIIYGEETIIEVPGINRLALLATLARYSRSIKHLQYSVSEDIRKDYQDLQYIPMIIKCIDEMKVITHQEFNDNRAKWLRYLFGTGEVELVLRFEDRFGYSKGVREYRVIFESSHLNDATDAKDGKYHIYIQASTAHDDQSPNERRLKDSEFSDSQGSFEHNNGLARFLEIGNHYVVHLHLNAKKGPPQFEIAPDLKNIDFRYATIVPDIKGIPITLTSWRTPYDLDGRLLHGRRHHYLQLWGLSPTPLRLDEGIHFAKGTHPKEFNAQLIDAIARTEYNKGSSFLQKAIDLGVPLIEPN